MHYSLLFTKAHMNTFDCCSLNTSHIRLILVRLDRGTLPLQNGLTHLAISSIVLVHWLKLSESAQLKILKLLVSFWVLRYRYLLLCSYTTGTHRGTRPRHNGTTLVLVAIFVIALWTIPESKPIGLFGVFFTLYGFAYFTDLDTEQSSQHI